jgi:hypothetical protein
MKVMKAMQIICLIGIIFSSAAVEGNITWLLVILFFCISLFFFTVAIRTEENTQKRLIELNNDLYEHSHY